jgi:hypothetical protein
LLKQEYPPFSTPTAPTVSFLCSLNPHCRCASFYLIIRSDLLLLSRFTPSHLASIFTFLFSLRSINSAAPQTTRLRLKQLNKPRLQPSDQGSEGGEGYGCLKQPTFWGGTREPGALRLLVSGKAYLTEGTLVRA